VSLNFVVFDEFAYIDEKAWTEVIRPTLSTEQGSALFITTPNGATNWAYDLYQRGLNPDEHKWESFQYTTIDGGYVTDEEIEQAKQDLDQRTFKQEYLASFESYANRVYYAFDPKLNIRKYEKETPLTIHVGLDFNVSPMSAVIFAQEGNTVHAFDEITLLSSNTDEIVDEIQNRYPTQKVIVYPDPAGTQRKTSAGGLTDHKILYNAGFIVKSPNKHNAVRDGNNAVNAKLCNVKGERTLFIDPKCKKTIDALAKHSYKDNSSVPDKDTGFDHMADAIRYYIDYVFPVKRDLPEYVPQRFGHSIK
jgi:hypothetical protein